MAETNFVIGTIFALPLVLIGSMQHTYLKREKPERQYRTLQRGKAMLD